MEDNEKYCYPYNIIHKAVKLSEEIRAEGDYLRSGGTPEHKLAFFIRYMFYGLDMRVATRVLDIVKEQLLTHSIVGECFCDECEEPLERVKNMNERYIKRMEELKKRDKNQ